jgi:hypothetical protein
VIVLNDETTIMEFDTYQEADNIAKIFELNSDIGLKYKVKPIIW